MVSFKVKVLHVKIFFGLIAVVGVTAVGVITFLRQNPSVLGSSKVTTAGDPQKELDQLVAEIKKVMILPGDEVPTLATVSEAEKLSSQTFFKNAQNGDKVLIYKKVRKAILWRPSARLIIEVGTVTSNEKPVSPDSSANNETDASAKMDAPKRVLFANGTTQPGLASAIADQAKTIPGVVVVDRVIAKRTDYEKTIIVDLTGKRELEAQFLSQEIGGEVSTLPEGEVKSEGVDFMVILGTDLISD